MATCSIDGCEYPAKTRGWCQAHYMRWWSTGVIGGEIKRRERGRICSVEGCERKHQGRGYCDGHLRRFTRYGDPGPADFELRRPGATCDIEGCDNPHQGLGLCDKHLQRLKKTGNPLTPLPPNPRWTGDGATYNAIHFRLRYQRGRAKDQTCIDCGAQAHHWSYNYSDPDPKFNDKHQPYSTDLSNYSPRCKTCHRQFDAEATRTHSCTVEGCDNSHKALGLCSKHYQRRRTNR